jgi:hypothetical protein
LPEDEENQRYNFLDVRTRSINRSEGIAIQSLMELLHQGNGINKTESTQAID